MGKTNSFLVYPQVRDIAILLIYTSLLVVLEVWIDSSNANAQIDCGTVDGVQLPCWRDYLESPHEGDESLPDYPYAKRPNGCSIPGARPGANDSINAAGINISFTDICNKHDRCYYTLGTTPWECNDPFQSGLRGRCEREIADHAPNLFDIITGGISRAEVLKICYTEATAIAAATIGTQNKYYRIAQETEKGYLSRVDCFTKENSDSPMPIVYVDAATTSACKSGHEQTPYYRICPSIKRVQPNGTITIQAGSYPETLAIQKNATLTASGGIVTIGKGSNREQCRP